MAILARPHRAPVAGVCAALGHRFGFSANKIRLGFVLANALPFAGVVLYVALWWLIPAEE